MDKRGGGKEGEYYGKPTSHWASFPLYALYPGIGAYWIRLLFRHVLNRRTVGTAEIESKLYWDS